MSIFFFSRLLSILKLDLLFNERRPLSAGPAHDVIPW
jgi:hypothetical protein